jgi:hypothetical protein
MEFRVHWLSITIWGNINYGLKIWQEWFENYLGIMHSSGHGGRGFKNIYTALASSRLYGNPPLGQDADEKDDYFYIELPGKACDAIPIYSLKEFLIDIMLNEKCSVKRIDLAWDNVPFSPSDINYAIDNDMFKSLIRKNTLVFTQSLYEERDDGQIGTSSCSIGSRSSVRMLRVYDKRGPTRLEFQARDDRAHNIVFDLIRQPIDKWSRVSRGHLRDYIDFVDVKTGAFTDWWGEFVVDITKADLIISSPRDEELGRIFKWFNDQVSPSFSVLVDVLGNEVIQEFLKEGRIKRRNRFKSILELSKSNGGNNEARI